MLKELEEKQIKEYEKFKFYVNVWLEKLGLSDWKVLYFKRMEHENDSPYARVSYILGQKECWIYFWGDAVNSEVHNIQEKALHEVLHLLLAELKPEPMHEHGIINRLLKMLMQGG